MRGCRGVNLGVQFPQNKESGSVKANSLPESDRCLTSTKCMYVCYMRVYTSSQKIMYQSVVECAVAPSWYK